MASAVKYIANVGKSVKYATVDALKGMNPVVTDMIETNQDIAKVTYSSIKNFKSLSAKAMKSLSNSQVGELAKDMKKNLMEDIKNGTFYNKKRLVTKTTDAINNSDMFSGEDFDFEVINEDDESETIKASKTTIDAVSNVMARTAEYQVEATRQSTNRILAQTAAMNATLHSDLGILNANISGIVKFNAESMTTHLQNSQKFYERQQEQMSEQTSILREILDLQKSVLTPKSKNINSKVNVNDIFTSEGSINLAEYFKLIKQNLENADPTGLSSMIKSASGMGMSSVITSNPLGFIMTQVIEHSIPKILKNTFTEFNETLTGSMATALINVSKAKDSFNPIANMIGNIFGIDLSVKNKINTSDYNKDAVPWNGKDHKALTEVIPTLLSKIYSTISNTDETRYNYESGKFTSIKKIKRDFKHQKERYVGQANDTILPYINDAISNIDFGSTQRQKEFVKNLERILKQNLKNMEYFNPNDRSKSAKSYGLKGINAERDLELIRRIYAQIPKNKQLKNQRDLLEAQKSMNEWLSGLESSGDSVFNSLFNNSKNKKELKSPSMVVSEKIDTTNSILEDIRNILSGRKIHTNISNRTINKNSAGIILPNNEAYSISKKDKDAKLKTGTGIYIDNNKKKKYKYTDDIDSFIFSESTDTPDTYLKKLQKAETATQKLTALLSGTSTLAKQPIKFLSNVLKKTDERMYTLLFGSDKEGKNSILGKITDGLDIWFENLKNLSKEKLNDLKNWLFGKNIKEKATGILNKLFGINTEEWFRDFKKSAFGSENISIGEGIRNIFKNGFKEIYQGIKDTFKHSDSISVISSTIKGDLTSNGNKKKSEKKTLNDIEKTLTKKALNIQKKAKESGIGETDIIEGYATGTRRVSRTGIVAVSEGEMIIPPDMNPYNISQRQKAEQKSIEKFEKAFGKTGNIQSFAKGGIFEGKNKEKLDNLIDQISRNVRSGKTKDLSRLINSISKLSKPARDYILNNLSDETIATLRSNFGDIKSKLTKNITRDDYTEGKENIVYKMHDTAKNILSDAKENTVINNILTKISQSFNKNEKTTSEGKEIVNDVMNNFSKYLPKIAAGGVTGLALSTLLGLAGGPILGAAVGSGLGLLSNSKKLQKWLFGEKVVDNDGNESIKGGILGDDIKKNIHKYFPNMSKGAIIGGITSILPFVPGGPMAGILVGSAVGFAKSNDKLSKQLFGEDKALDKMKKTLENKLPGMGLGAAAMFLGGPFGITTNLMVGAGLGFVSDTEKFKDIVFGTKGSNGDRTGGLVGFIKAATEIPIENIKAIWNDTRKWFTDKFLSPLKKAADPFARQLKNIGNWFKDAITDGIKEHVAKPIGARVLKFLQPIEKVTGTILRGLLFPIRGLLSIPSKAAGAAGGILRKRQLRRVGAASGSASQRVAEMEALDANRFDLLKRFTNTESYRSAKYISQLSDDDLLDINDQLEYIKADRRFIKKGEKEKILKNAGIRAVNKSDKMFFNDLKQKTDLDSRYRVFSVDMNKTITDLIIDGKADEVYKIIMNQPSNPTRGFSDKQKKNFANRAKRAAQEASKGRENAKNAAAKAKQIKDKTGIDVTKVGFKRDIEQDIKLRGLDNNQDEQNKSTEEKLQDTVVEVVDLNKLHHDQVMQSLNKISDILEDIAYPNSKKAQDTKKKVETNSINNTKRAEEEKLLPMVITPTDAQTIAEDGSTSDVRELISGKATGERVKNLLRRMTNNIFRKKKQSKTVITENGPIKIRVDAQGNEIPDERDSETKETLSKSEEKNNTQKGILEKISGLGNSIKSFLGFDKKEDKEESVFTKIIKGALKYALPIFGGLAGIGLISKAANKTVKVQQRDAKGNKIYDENGNPVMTEMTIADAVKNGASRMWLGDDLTGDTDGAWYHIKDFTSNTLIPAIGSGIDLLSDRLPSIIGAGVETIVTNAPHIITAIGAGLAKGLWSILKDYGLSKIPVVGNLFKESDNTKSSKSIESGTTTLKVGLSNNSNSVISNNNVSTISNRTPIQNTNTSSTITNNKVSSNNSGFTTPLQSTYISEKSFLDVNSVKQSLAYNNASPIVQKKALNQLASVWNNKVLDDGTTVGQLCNDQDTIIAEFQDNTGATYSVTGADILLYPDIAAQVLGMDISFTDSEREKNSEYVRSVTNTNPANWSAFKVITSGGKYGKGAATASIKAINKIGDFANYIGKGSNKILSKMPGGKKIGKIASMAGKSTKFLSNVASVPIRTIEGGRKIISNYSASRRLGKSVSESIEVAKKGVGLRTRKSVKNAKNAFNTVMDAREAARAEKLAKKSKSIFGGIRGRIQKGKNTIIDKIDNTARNIGNKALDTVSNATKIDSSDVSKATKGVKEALNKVLKKGGKIGSVVGNVTEKAGKLTSKAKDVVNKLRIVLEKFLSNNKVVGALQKVLKSGKAKKEIIEATIKEGLEKFANKILEKFTKGIAKSSAKIIAKLSTKLAAYIGSGGLVVAGFLIVDFIGGMSKADAIMGVEKPTIVERFISGLVNAFAETFFITLVIDTNTLVQMCIDLLEHFGVNLDDLRKRQKEAEENCEKYNREYGTNYSVEEYLMSDNLSTKIKSALKNAGGKIINFGKSIGKGIVDFVTGDNSKEDDLNSTVNKVTAAEESVISGSYIYDSEGNIVGYDKNNDGNADEMYISQGDSNTTDTTSISTETKISGKSLDKISNKEETKLEDIRSINSYTKSDDYTDQVKLAMTGSSSVISGKNQQLINQAYLDINNSIPNMIKQLKENLAKYFGVRASDMDRTTAIGINTMKGNGPDQLFRQLKSMWSQATTKIGPFTKNLPKTLYSGMKDLSRFLAISMGFAAPEDEDVDLNELVKNESYVDQRAQQVLTNSPFAWLGGISGTSSINKDTQESSYQEMVGGDKSNSETFTQKITNGAKGFIKAIGNFFGIGGSGSGLDGQTSQDYDRSSLSNAFISQKNGNYANKPFTVTGDKTKQTISDAGCAPAVATMAINAAGYSAVPITMDQAMKNALKYKKPNSGVTADYFIDEFDRHGLNAAYITSQNPNMKSTIIKRLANGTPIILMGRDKYNKAKSKSPFGPKTHYVVATGISKDKNTIYVNDPEASKPKIPYKTSSLLNGVMLGVAPVIRNNAKDKVNSMVTKIKRLLSKFSASGKYGEDTIQYKVWTQLRAEGYSEIATAAAMGNIQHESGFNPSAIESGTGKGFGLIQWTGGRRTAIENYANQKGEDVKSIDLQIEYLIIELRQDSGIWTSANSKYKFGSLSRDDWENGTDIETATKAFMACFERPDYNTNINHIDKRIQSAKEYYEEFTGTSIPDESNYTATSDDTQSPIEQLLSSFSKLASAYGLTGDASSGTTSNDNFNETGISTDSSIANVDGSDIVGNVSNNKKFAEKQIELVKKMKSVEGKLQYSQTQRNPDTGSGDCSSTIQWAYNKVLGVDVGDWTGAQESSPQTTTVASNVEDQSKLQLGDIILYRKNSTGASSHVEMYYATDKMIGHGGGANGTTPGPTVKALAQNTGSQSVAMVKRYNGFLDGGSGSGLFVSQNDSKYANKKIGSYTVSDAGCAPAVATMAISSVNRNDYNMNNAIKNASKYQNNNGEVTADYFADEFIKNGINPSYIAGTDISKLKSAISRGNVVLLGKDTSNNTKNKSPFGPSGHYVLATGLSNDGKYVYINDPESRSGNKKYSVDILKHTILGVNTIGGTAIKLTSKIRNKLKLFYGKAKYTYIFTGDSRTVGMELAVGSKHPETKFIAQISIGYSWMKNNAIPQIVSSMSNNTKIVFLFGVNDLHNIDNYIKEYKTFEKQYKNSNKIYYVSVNPVNNEVSVTNEQIENFNIKLKEFAGNRYIDTYSMLKKDGYSSSDGLHYDTSTNEKIYNYIINSINGNNVYTNNSNESITDTTNDQNPLNQLINAFNDLAIGYGLKGRSTSSSTDETTNSTSENVSSESGSFSGSTGAEKTWSYFKNKGIPDEGVAGLMGNIEHESGFKFNNVENLLETRLKEIGKSYNTDELYTKAIDDNTIGRAEFLNPIPGKQYGYGLVQWTSPGRKAGLYDLAKSKKKSIADPGVQLDWLWKELNESYPGVLDTMRNSKDIRTVSTKVLTDFESPADQGAAMQQIRYNSSQKYYDQYHGSTIGGSGSGIMDTPSYNYSTKTYKSTNTKTVKSNNIQSNNNDKLIEVLIKLLSQVVINTSSIKDIANLLIKLMDLKVNEKTNNASDTATKGVITASQLALQALRESTRTTEDEEIAKLIKSVESIAMQ